MEMIIVKVRNVDPARIGQVTRELVDRELRKALPATRIGLSHPWVAYEMLTLRPDRNERIAVMSDFQGDLILVLKGFDVARRVYSATIFLGANEVDRTGLQKTSSI